MNLKLSKLIVVALIIVLPLMSGCFKILTLDQATTANVGEQIQTFLEVRTAGTDENAHYGIVGLLVPNDWTIDSVYFFGDYGPDYCTFLHPDSIDGDPGGQVDFWTDSLEVYFPSGEAMQWLVYQSSEPYTADYDTAYADLYIDMTVGSTAGNFNIGYFISNAALDFSDSTFYTVSLENPIEVTDNTHVATTKADLMPGEFALNQNYPNPFNPTTTITYNLSTAGRTRLAVYNVLGAELVELVNEEQSAGIHQTDFNAAQLASGVYYYRLETATQTAIRKMILLR